MPDGSFGGTSTLPHPLLSEAEDEPLWVYLDIETRSAVNLIAKGVYVYAEHPSTAVILLSWAIGDGPITTWYIMQGEPIPDELRDAILHPRARYVAHNAGFERILLTVVGQKFLAADIWNCLRRVDYWTCTAARAAVMGLPRSLAGAARALHTAVTKDQDGHDLMMVMCAPIRLAPDGTWIWLEDIENQRRLGAYCEIDVAVERELAKDLPPLSEFEQQVWCTTERMNDRGIGVDEPLLQRLYLFAGDAEHLINQQISDKTNKLVSKVTQVKALEKWCIDNGLSYAAGEKGVGKWIIQRWLEDDSLPSLTREVLVLRKEGGKSSTKKFGAIASRLNLDSRIRGSILYCGATSTSRFSSRGAQLHNLPRGVTVKDMEQAIADILDGYGPEDIRGHGPPLVVASEMARPVFVAKLGHWLSRGDYSQIEARVLAWIAGEHWKLDAFRAYDDITGWKEEKGELKPIRRGPDLYTVGAASIFGCSLEEVTYQLRQGGKVGELACIAEGQLVLTDVGLIPIESVTTDMMVWDGVEWVSHDGIVYRGERECIEYDGLCATADHRVYVEDSGTTLSFWEAAERRLRLCGQHVEEPVAASRGAWNAGTLAEVPQCKTKRKVWDILNAGPRHRFTVSGRLVHNCGYQGGYKAILAMARLYNIKLTEERAEEIKVAWRAANPSINQFWYDLDNAALECMESPRGKKIHVRPGLWFKRNSRALALRVPGGGALIYWYPELEKVKTPWGSEKWAVTFTAEDSQKHIWVKHIGYGGLFCENVCQKIARDIMAYALNSMDADKMAPCLTVHDEAICQISRDRCPTTDEAAKIVSEIMLVQPDCYAGLPIAADASAHSRYLKKS